MCWSGKWEDSKHIHSDAEPISGAGGWRRLESPLGRPVEFACRPASLFRMSPAARRKAVGKS
jgi:hypothetical protein